jgi:regulatory protein YycH of two-component signal transduction system YycFG
LDGNTYGTIRNGELDKIIAMISKWKYYDVAKTPEQGSALLERLSKSQHTEIIFPEEVPVELYRKVLNFEDKDLPKFEFDRILIHSDAGGQEGVIYFYSSKNQNAYKSNVSLAAVTEFVNEFQSKGTRQNEYFAHKMANGKNVYLPVERTEMLKYTYYRNPIEPEKLKEALFRDPSFVQRSTVSDGEEYADEASKMTVDHSTSMIYYVNPFRENEAVVGTSNLVQKSIDFINAHGGWTDNYRYVYKDDFNQRIVFRIYSKEGYPIFNQLGMSEILQIWGQSEINRYIRPSFHLELPLNPEMNSVTLPSGEEVVRLLGQRTDLKPELLKDISPGYYMTRDSQDSSLIFLEPGWFYQYDDVWRELTLNEEVR